MTSKKRIVTWVVITGMVIGLLALSQLSFTGQSWAGPPRLPLTADGATWDLAGHGANFEKLDLFAPDGGWGLTHKGYLYRFDGTSWWFTAGPEDAAFLDIDAVSAQEAWAVGYRPSVDEEYDGMIWRYDGQTWRPMLSEATRHLTHLEMKANGKGWAAGDGVAVRYLDGKWKSSTVTPATHLNDISDANGTLWGVGFGVYQLQWDVQGSTWQQMNVFTNTHLTAIDVTDGSGWAVGESGTILHYDGANWVAETSPVTTTLHTVLKVSEAKAWAGGDNGELLYRSGGVWQVVNSGTNHALMSLAMADTDHLWLGGHESTLKFFDGGIWTDQSSTITPNAFTTESLHDVVSVTTDNSWAVGGFHNEGSVVLHNAGDGWMVVGHPLTQTLRGLDILPGGQGWVVGGDHRPESAPVFTFDSTAGGSTQFMRQPTPITGTLTAVDMIDINAGFAVGSNRTETAGVMIAYNGAAWLPVALPANTAPLNDVAMVSQGSGGTLVINDGWAVGRHGTLLRYSNGQWIDARNLLDDGGEDLIFHAIDMVSPTDGWLVGVSNPFQTGDEGTIMLPYSYHGVIFHFDGSRWNRVFVDDHFLEGLTLRDVGMTDAFNGWIVGDNGTILNYANGAWQMRNELQNMHFNAVAMAADDPTVGFVMGQGGVMLYAVAQQQRIFLPLIQRASPVTPTPTPTPLPTPVPPQLPSGVVYDYDFNDTDYRTHPDWRWPTFETDGAPFGNCDFYRGDGHYTMAIDRYSLSPCFRFAPAAAEREYGAFEAKMSYSGGNPDTEYGIYINGSGGDEYYLFRIRTDNDCGWSITKRRDNHNETVASGGCSHINRGQSGNTLRMEHIRRNGQEIVAVWINGVYLGKFQDIHHTLHGRGVGMFGYTGHLNPNAAWIHIDRFTEIREP